MPWPLQCLVLSMHWTLQFFLHLLLQLPPALLAALSLTSHPSCLGQISHSTLHLLALALPFGLSSCCWCNSLLWQASHAYLWWLDPWLSHISDACTSPYAMLCWVERDGGGGRGGGTRALAYLSWCSRLLLCRFAPFLPTLTTPLIMASRVWGSRRTGSAGLVWVVDDEPSSDMVAPLRTRL